jgi:signal transduction histidine kinase
MRFENSHLEMLIEDDGITIPEEKLENPTGNGLRNMRERSMQLGGNIQIGPREGGGTVVALILPVGEN